MKSVRKRDNYSEPPLCTDYKLLKISGRSISGRTRRGREVVAYWHNLIVEFEALLPGAGNSDGQVFAA